jgi:TrkA domain protein
MTDVEETMLPGVGIRQDFQTAAGRRIGVIVHHAGYRELLIYDDRDPDQCREVLRIDEHEAHTLAEMLGAAHVHPGADTAVQSVGGITIDWMPIARGSAFDGRTIGELALRERTGVTVVALIRDGRTMASPGPDDQLRAGDTAVVAGPPDAVARAFALLHDG